MASELRERLEHVIRSRHMKQYDTDAAFYGILNLARSATSDDDLLHSLVFGLSLVCSQNKECRDREVARMMASSR